MFKAKVTCCEEVNDVNSDEKEYYDKRYRISIGISNALWSDFDIYAYHEMNAFEQLVDFLELNDAKGLYETYDELKKDFTEEEIEEDFLYVDGGAYFNQGYTTIKEISI